MKKKDLVAIIIIVIVILGLLYFLLMNNGVPITKLYLNKSTINLLVGEEEKIDVSIEPNNANNKNIIWESSNSSVAIVNDGKITALNDGITVITAMTKDKKISDSCIINVYKKEINQVIIREEEIKLKLGETKELEITVNPIEMKKMFTYVSSDESIVKVDEKGKIYGVKNGVATISIKMRDDIVATCKVSVVIPVETLSLSNESLTLELGKSSELKFTVTPEEAANQEITWQSNDEEVADVKNGTVLAKGVGETTIKVLIGDKEAVCRIKVINSVKKVSLNKTSISMNRGDSKTITVTITPNNVTNKKVTWISSNERIAKVDKDGKITGIGSGEATITATVDGKKATCKVTVTYTPITENSKYKKGYTTIASYNSDTLKYRIQKVKDEYYTLVWVENANKQWNSAFPKYGNRYPQKEILETEIKKYNYQNKGLVATNSSPFWDGWGDSPCVPFVMNKGNIIRDIKNTEYDKKIYVNIGITEKGDLKEYKFTKKDYAHNQKVKQNIIKDGVKNTFASFAAILKEDGKLSGSNTTCDTSNPNTYCFNKTILCQVDRNNFIIFSGGKSLSYLGIAYKLRDDFNCKVAYAYDGGASNSLYYKTKSKTPQMIFNGQNVPDMMYFVEQ